MTGQKFYSIWSLPYPVLPIVQRLFGIDSLFVMGWTREFVASEATFDTLLGSATIECTVFRMWILKASWTFLVVDGTKPTIDSTNTHEFRVKTRQRTASFKTNEENVN